MMQRSILPLLISLMSISSLCQQPSQREIQAQIQQAKNKSMQMIAEMEKEIADAKKRGDDPESIIELEKQLVTMKKMLGVVDKAAGLNYKRPRTTDVPVKTIPVYKSPFIPIILKQPVVAPTKEQAKDRLLWYRGRRINDSMLVTPQARVVLYSKRRNMVIVQPNEKRDSAMMKNVKNLARSRQWTNNIVNNVAGIKNSFFDYPLMIMAIKELDYIEKEYNKLADNTIKLPGTGANLIASVMQLSETASGPFVNDEINSTNTLDLETWARQKQQELRNLMNNQPPLDFPPPPKHEFDLCYYCDTSLQGKYYREKANWFDKFYEYEAKLISSSLGIQRQYALLAGSDFDLSNSGITGLKEDIDGAMSLGLERINQKTEILKLRYSNDVYRMEVVATCILSLARQYALLGIESNSYPEFDFLKMFGTYIQQEITARNYNVIFNYSIILGHERQLALLGVEQDFSNSLFWKVSNINRFALTMDIEFNMVVKDDNEEDVMRATGYLTTTQKTYVRLGRNKCKWQLYLFDPDYILQLTDEKSFEIQLKILEGVRLIKEVGKWVSYTYVGPPEMRFVSPSIRIDFCNNSVQDSALMDVIRYSDQDLASVTGRDEIAKKYIIDMQEYVNLVFGSVTKTKANRDAVIDITDDIIAMQSGTTVTSTGYVKLDKMQIDYNMHLEQLKIKERITNTTKETSSVILFDATNKSPTLIDKQADMSGDRGYKIEMKKALVKLKVEHEPL